MRMLLLSLLAACQTTWTAVDADGDGFSILDGDCNDQSTTINPGAGELCDSVDSDCDGDLDDPEAADTHLWHSDNDGDGYGDPTTSIAACTLPDGAVEDGTDCDDSADDVFPGAAEFCDAIDSDCDGTTDDEEASGTTFYADADGDGYGDDLTTVSACDPPAGYVDAGGDCDDSDAAFHPGASETDCADPSDYNCDGSTGYDDADEDGWVACQECDDTSAAVNPDAVEVCNDIDDDCEGGIDEPDAADAATWYADTDGDGYGDADSTTPACDQPDGFVGDATDCDDGTAFANPGEDERCDEIDNDCDAEVDEDSAVDADTWYADVDGDGYGDPGTSVAACGQPSGYVADANDCDDGVFANNPGADEICDGADNNCDGDIDEDSAADAATWYADTDADGFGDSTVTYVSCEAPANYVADDTDCDDAEGAVNPDADELCDGFDDDCDGETDEDSAVDASPWYADTDGDGYGDISSIVTACDAPVGYVGDATDCDDGAATASPAGTEVCGDSLDNDCNGTADGTDATDASTWYRDADSDGYGSASVTTRACTQPSGYVSGSTDCNDSYATAHPGASELCSDAIDNDCDGSVNESDATDALTWYQDSDGDLYGNAAVTVRACTEPAGYEADDDDCNDSAYSVNPGATEYCDGIDNNCAGGIDESTASDALTWYQDSDNDGFGNAAVTTRGCTEPAGYEADDDDCDDTDSSVKPGAAEYCDDEDDDCDGVVDDSALDASTWYYDADGDGFGDAATTSSACDAPTDYVADDTDCDDTDANVNPDSPWLETTFASTPATLDLNGSGSGWVSAVSSGVLQLTQLAFNKAGSAVYTTRIPGDHWYVSFDFAIYGYNSTYASQTGVSGGEGLTFFWVDDTDTGTLGDNASSLGIANFNGNGHSENGYAVEVDTVPSSTAADPSVDHVALMDIDAWDDLDWFASGSIATAATSATTATWFTLEVEMDAGTVTYTLTTTSTGTVVDTSSYAIPDYTTDYGDVLVGWSAGTGASSGGAAAYQVIDNVYLGCPQ